ncbi:hypothetical protein AGOR_G00242760 [Albula goreensis]|uniref:Uncharacterized protein n=1 Tax=Albula goreensis TaxID=1534307 RepID=A0A8T3CH68_9TELE|nr:hypothetical protein AGOR_G00242760 [Albula goreensis]
MPWAIHSLHHHCFYGRASASASATTSNAPTSAAVLKPIVFALRMSVTSTTELNYVTVQPHLQQILFHLNLGTVPFAVRVIEPSHHN